MYFFFFFSCNNHFNAISMGSGGACPNVLSSLQILRGQRTNVRSCQFCVKMDSVESNSVQSLKEITFSQRSDRSKLATKQAGPPRPNVKIKQVSSKGGKSYTRGFSTTWYERKSWLAGCEEATAVFCYPCLLFHPGSGSTDNTAWTVTGVSDMHHLSEKIKKHESSKVHMDRS